MTSRKQATTPSLEDVVLKLANVSTDMAERVGRMEETLARLTALPTTTQSVQPRATQTPKAESLALPETAEINGLVGQFSLKASGKKSAAVARVQSFAKKGPEALTEYIDGIRDYWKGEGRPDMFDQSSRVRLAQAYLNAFNGTAALTQTKRSRGRPRKS